MRFGDVDKMKESTLKRFMRLPKFDEHMELHRLDCLSSHRMLRMYEIREANGWSTRPTEEIRPPALLNGNDLIAMGYRPGAGFREILSAVEDAQLEGSLHNKEEAQ